MMSLNIRQERIKRNWTQEYVAQQIDISPEAVQMIETGKREPSYKVLVKLENLFNLSHRKLFAVADEEVNS
jgi:putative transcriptional regulator